MSIIKIIIKQIDDLLVMGANLDHLLEFITLTESLNKTLEVAKAEILDFKKEIKVTQFLVDGLLSWDLTPSICDSLLDLKKCFEGIKKLDDMSESVLQTLNEFCMLKNKNEDERHQRELKSITDYYEKNEDERHQRELKSITEYHEKNEDERHQRELKSITDNYEKNEDERHQRELEQMAPKKDKEKLLAAEIERHQVEISKIVVKVQKENNRHLFEQKNIAEKQTKEVARHDSELEMIKNKVLQENAKHNLIMARIVEIQQLIEACHNHTISKNDEDYGTQVTPTITNSSILGNVNNLKPQEPKKEEKEITGNPQNKRKLSL